MGSKAIAKEGIGRACSTRLKRGEAEYTTRRKWGYFGTQDRVHSEFTDLYLQVVFDDIFTLELHV